MVPHRGPAPGQGDVVTRLVRRTADEAFVSLSTWLSLGVGLFILAIPILDPSALYSFRTSGRNGLSILTVLGASIIIGWNSFVVFYSWIRKHFIYRNARKSAAWRFVLGMLIGSFIIAPYGLDIRNIALPAFLFFAVTSVSFGTWTHWKLADLMWASRRLLWNSHANYRKFIGFESSFDQLEERISICRECLTLVGNEDEKCWRCEVDLRTERLVASVNGRLKNYSDNRE